VNAVVDRHDGPALHERRQHVVRRVKQRDPSAERPGILICSMIDNCRTSREPAGSSLRPPPAFRDPPTAEDDELGLAVDARQVPQQVPMRADAESQLAGVMPIRTLHHTQAVGWAVGRGGGSGGGQSAGPTDWVAQVVDSICPNWVTTPSARSSALVGGLDASAHPTLPLALREDPDMLQQRHPPRWCFS
jgi:hypothetical protein